MSVSEREVNMVQLYVGTDENKGKSYITIPLADCESGEKAVTLANRLYFKEKIDRLEYTKGYAYKGVLKVGSWIGKEHLNVWVVARK